MFVELILGFVLIVLCHLYRNYFRQEELSEKSSILSVRKDELDAASKQWKNRVEQSDAVNFSVAGRMQQENDVPTIPINIPIPDKLKRTPKAKTFKGREG